VRSIFWLAREGLTCEADRRGSHPVTHGVDNSVVDHRIPRAYSTDYHQMWLSGAGVLLLAGLASAIEMIVGWHGSGRYSGLQGVVVSVCLAAVAWRVCPRMPLRWMAPVGRIFLFGSVLSVTASVYSWRGTELAGASAFNYLLIIFFAAFYFGGRDVLFFGGLMGISYWFAAGTGDTGLDILGWSLVMEVVAGTGIAVLFLSRRMAELSHRDALTGALNRRAWDRALAVELDEHRRHAGPIGVAIVDIDDLKVVNDRDGHEAGDALLRDAVRVWSSSLRGDDVIARVGGDEFGIIFLGTEPADAARVAERLIETIRHELGATCTIGVATALPGARPRDVLAVADRLLYDGKARGRARLMTGRVPVAA
jgi:diguanylate cyclase (GGDEF)-like protein